MRTVLHIISRQEETFARQLIARQKEQHELKVEVVDLTQPEPDYTAVLEKIFAADSIAVW